MSVKKKSGGFKMPDINFIKEVVERAFDPFSELPAIYAKKEKMVDEYIERSEKRSRR